MVLRPDARRQRVQPSMEERNTSIEGLATVPVGVSARALAAPPATRKAAAGDPDGHATPIDPREARNRPCATSWARRVACASSPEPLTKRRLPAATEWPALRPG